MRSAVAMFAIFTTGALSFAVADPPADPPAATNPTPAPSSSQAAPTQAAQPDATAAAMPPVAPAKPTPGASDERTQERLLLNQGYKLTMVHGEEKYCRREAQLGSRIATVMHCVTLAEAEEMAREGRDTTERIQRSMPACLTQAAGGCGH